MQSLFIEIIVGDFMFKEIKATDIKENIVDLLKIIGAL